MEKLDEPRNERRKVRLNSNSVANSSFFFATLVSPRVNIESKYTPGGRISGKNETWRV